MRRLEQDVLSFIRRQHLMRAGDRVGVAVSGGGDSVALLRILLALRSKLGIVVALAHLNHKIRGAAADEDAAFVARLASEHDLELHSEEADAPAFAREHQIGLEAAGRKLRYDFFARLIAGGKLTRIAMAHTADDQAETVLMRILRGAGTRGLAGIYPQRSAEPKGNQAPGKRDSAADGNKDSCADIVRPLLATRRCDLRKYLRDAGQPWREDSSNRDVAFLRNRVRHELLPLLETHYNPGIVGVLANTAESARAEEQYWSNEIARALSEVRSGESSLDVHRLLAQPQAVQRRLIRAMAQAHGCQFDFDPVERLLAFALEPPSAGPAAIGGSRRSRQSRASNRATRFMELPGNLRVHRTFSESGLRLELRFERAVQRKTREPGVGLGCLINGEGASRDSASLNRRASAHRANTYQYGFRVPGEVEIRELGKRMRASLRPMVDGLSGYNREQFLDPRSLAPELLVRNWRPGDRFWPAHTKAPRKLKELLQERRVSQPERALWPVVVSGDEIVWVRGFAPAKPHLARANAQALVIEEFPLVET